VTFTNNIVARNVVSPINPSALNIYGTAARVANNTIADNPGPGPAVYFHTSNGIVIANNIISGNGMGIYCAEGTTPIYTADYNDVYNNSGGNYYNVSPGSHDLSVNPGFIGSGNMLAYYHLQLISPVSKTGSLAYAPPFDIDGELRMNCFISMGADQIGCKHLYLPLIMR
jgi:parallel beta-helix repeat protein